MSSATVQLEPSWLALLQQEFEAAYMRQLSDFLRSEKRIGKKIYPPGEQMFAALDATPVERVKVVIIGQDPYHGAGQAHGLCFSVPQGVAPPPSLINIFKEIETDLGAPVEFPNGNLTGWADQGVLLLNSVLSVEHGRAGSHQGRGWERFTDAIVRVLNEHRQGLVFLLWGSYAQKKGAVVDNQRHCILSSPHPSPLSAHRGFFGSRPFSQANRYLQQNDQEPINWQQTNRLQRS